MVKSKKQKKEKATHESCDHSSVAESDRLLLVKRFISPHSESPAQPLHIPLSRQQPCKHIYIVDGFLIPQECAKWIDYGESKGFVDVFQKATADYAHRDNGRIQYDDPAVAESIFCRLKDILPPSVDGLQPSSCSSNIRLYRYKAGQRFGRHIDESIASPDGESKFTLLIYLNGQKGLQNSEEDFVVGGETKFYSSMYGSRPVLSVPPMEGRLLLHGHGHRCLTHEGGEVLAGIKYLLRTDVIYN